MNVGSHRQFSDAGMHSQGATSSSAAKFAQQRIDSSERSFQRQVELELTSHKHSPILELNDDERRSSEQDEGGSLCIKHLTHVPSQEIGENLIMDHEADNQIEEPVMHSSNQNGIMPYLPRRYTETEELTQSSPERNISKYGWPLQGKSTTTQVTENTTLQLHHMHDSSERDLAHFSKQREQSQF